MKIKSVLICGIALLFKLIPRNRHLWITGKVTSWEYENDPPAFFDNSKYFFLYLVNHTNEKVYWVSSSNEEVDLLRGMGLPVVKFRSVRGIYLTLRAKYFFHHYGTDQIDRKLQFGSVQINFWHAMPFKKMRFSVVPREKQKNLFFKESTEYASSSSQYLSETVCQEMYGLPLSRILNFGYPRQDILNYSKENTKNFCKEYSKDMLDYIEIAEKYNSVFLYMPTWRDDDPDYFTKLNINYRRLSEELSKINGIMFLKLHPLTRYLTVEGYGNIMHINNAVDIYPFLTFVNYLITDYSSICYDYLLLDKEMIFIPYDIEKYLSMRGLYFEYDSVTPGAKYYTFDDFIDHIQDMPFLDYKDERQALREKFFDDYDYNASERTYKYFADKRNEGV